MAHVPIWTEQYRPQKLDEIVNQTHVVSRLRAWVKSHSVPNMLFAGGAGVGKTTTALVLAKELFGEHWKDNFQETNASDERGINVVRGRIKDFAGTKALGGTFKIIFLDESDALTPEAQQALRRTIERYAGTCRFILSCNYSSRIIEPIHSRMAVFRFKALSEEHVIEYLMRIIKGENLQVDSEALKTIYELSEGDLRKATNLLQTTASLGKITKEVVYEATSNVQPGDVKEMLSLTLSGNFKEGKKRLYTMLITQGLSGEDILREIHRELFTLNIPETRKLELLEKTGETEFRLNQGGTPEIQLGALLAQFSKNTK
jgi:replication factor C small subunit